MHEAYQRPRENCSPVLEAVLGCVKKLARWGFERTGKKRAAGVMDHAPLHSCKREGLVMNKLFQFRPELGQTEAIPPQI